MLSILQDLGVQSALGVFFMAKYAFSWYLFDFIIFIWIKVKLFKDETDILLNFTLIYCTLIMHRF